MTVHRGKLSNIKYFLFIYKRYFYDTVPKYKKLHLKIYFRKNHDSFD